MLHVMCDCLSQCYLINGINCSPFLLTEFVLPPCTDGCVAFLRKSHIYAQTTDFNEPWEDYKSLLGDLDGNFFLGTEVLHQLTNERDYRMVAYIISSATHSDVYPDPCTTGRLLIFILNLLFYIFKDFHI